MNLSKLEITICSKLRIVTSNNCKFYKYCTAIESTYLFEIISTQKEKPVYL